jgi:hypothetical protein
MLAQARTRETLKSAASDMLLNLSIPHFGSTNHRRIRVSSRLGRR